MRIKILLIFNVVFLLSLTANCQRRIFNKSHEPITHHFYGSLGIKNDQLFLDFYQKFKDSVNAKDSIYISNIIFYPIDISINKKDIIIKDKEQFIKYYSKIFTNKLVCIINKYSQVGDFMSNMEGVSIGLGEIWFNYIIYKENSPPQFKIIAINPIVYPRPEFEREKR